MIETSKKEWDKLKSALRESGVQSEAISDCAGPSCLLELASETLFECHSNHVSHRNRANDLEEANKDLEKAVTAAQEKSERMQAIAFDYRDKYNELKHNIWSELNSKKAINHGAETATQMVERLNRFIDFLRELFGMKDVAFDDLEGCFTRYYDSVEGNAQDAREQLQGYDDLVAEHKQRGLWIDDLQKKLDKLQKPSEDAEILNRLQGMHDLLKVLGFTKENK